jgi:hypothetical protein
MMKVYDIPLAVIILMIIPLTAYSEEAVTLSGKRVILHENGMWEYKKTVRVKEVKFRSMPWGSTAEQIKQANLEKPVFESENNLIYKDTINDLDTACSFIIVDGRFVRGKYKFMEDHTDTNRYIWDYEGIDKLLKEKYGDPNEEDELWLNDLWKDDPRAKGKSISAGHLALFSKWEIGEVDIVHILHGDNYKVEHDLEYSQNAMSIIEESLREKEDKSKL